MFFLIVVTVTVTQKRHHAQVRPTGDQFPTVTVGNVCACNCSYSELFAEVSDTSSLTSPGADSEPDFGWQQSWLSSRIIAVSCLSMWPRVDCSIAITSVSCQVFVGTVDNRRDPKKYNHNPALVFLFCFFSLCGRHEELWLLILFLSLYCVI